MTWKNKIVLITGANGFCGKNLAGILKEKGAKVALMPREMLSSYKHMESIFNEINPEYIFHLASYGNHSHQKDYIDEIFSTNVIKTYNVLRASANIEYKAFINVSSSSVYGNKKHAMREGMNLEPFTTYACTKAAGEHLAEIFAQVMKQPVVNVRPFSVYGPGEAKGRLIPNIINSMTNGVTLDLAEKPVHDWIYIEDFIEGMLLVAENAEKLRGQAVNIGTGNDYANAVVVETLLDIKPDAVFPVNVLDKGKIYDTDNWRANPSKLKKLGWKPKFTLKKGLQETYTYYSELLKEEPDFIADSLKQSGVEFKKIPKEMEEGLDKYKDKIIV